MKEEIAAAVFFVARLVKRYGSLEKDGRERFATALTSVLFEKYKNHWHQDSPSRGQAFRCLRMNQVLPQDPVLQQACERGAVLYEDLGLPRELTVWVDPGKVSCRYGEHGAPFCVSTVDCCRRGDGEFSRRVHDAVERASLDVPSESSDEDQDEEGEDDDLGGGPGCPTRRGPFSSGAPQTWLRDKWKPFPGDGFPPHPAPLPGGAAAHQFPPQKAFKPYRATFTFTGPRVDKYHWVSKSRS
uniref:Maternal B9.10 protein-like n=1 Tax=Salarias fasciatus TaxID=181472 RepID=A0A672GM37_SALFA